MGKKLYLIGIDSTPLWILRELSTEKGMDAIAKLLKGNYIHELESTLPPMTGPAWPTIYTGLTPAEHGVPDFFVMKDDHTPDVIFYDPIEHPPFWEELAKHGYKSLLITPATDTHLPTNNGNIDLLTGFPLRAKTNSPEIERLMRKHKFDGEPDIEKFIKDGKMTELEASKIFSQSVETRISIAKDMMALTNYDFVFVCFTETDRLQHFVMNKENRKDYLLPIYSKISAFLGELMRMVEKEGSTLMIVSDHGMQPIYEKFLLNSWLIHNGYASLKPKVLQKINSTQKPTKTSKQSAIREKLLKTNLRRVYDKLPHKAKSTVFNILGNISNVEMGGEYVRLHLFHNHLDKPRAFEAISTDPVSTKCINDSRFKNGIVKKGEKEKLKREIARKLEDLRDDSGEKVVKGTIDGGKYYNGTNKFIAADIFVEARDNCTIDIFNFSKDELFMPPESAKSGDHLRSGILCFYSKKAKKFTQNANVLNVAPTILNYYGIKSGTEKSLLKKLVD